MHTGIYKLSDRIGWVLWSRVVFLGVMATSAICLNLVYGDSIARPVLWAILLGLGFSFLSRLLLYLRLSKLQLLGHAYAQILADALLAGFLVHQTGGLYSAFILLFGLNIIASGIILFTRGVGVSLLCSLFAYSLAVLISDIELFSDAIYLSRFVFINSLLILVGGLVAVMFRGREQLVQSLERASSDLHQMMEVQSAVVENIPAGLLFISPTGKIIFSNPASEEILGRGYTGEAADALPFGRPLEAGLKEVRFQNDKRDQILLVQNLELDSGRRLLVLTDISQLRELESQVRVREKLAGVGQLAAGLAHEIKNPLASLSGSIQMLQSNAGSLEADKLMEIVLRETDRLDELLNGFLNYAKPSQMKYQKVDLVSLIQEVVELLKIQSQSKKISIAINAPDRLICRCDPAKLRQVVWNLGRNAVNAVDEGGSIQFVIQDLGSRARVEVIDNGAGIPKSIQEKIFEPFFSSGNQGTGLGLALVYQMIEAHSGKIGFSSEEGKGSEFWFEIEKELAVEESAA